MSFISRKASQNSAARIAQIAADDSDNESGRRDYADSDGDIYVEPETPIVDKVVTKRGSDGKTRIRPRIYLNESAIATPAFPMGPPPSVNNAAAFFTPGAPLTGNAFMPAAYPGLKGTKRPGAKAARNPKTPIHKTRQIDMTPTPRSEPATPAEISATPNGSESKEEYFEEVGSYRKVSP